MNKRVGLLLIFLTLLSFLGIILSQLYWIKNAYDLKKDQFDKRVLMGLKSISNTLFELQNAGTEKRVFLIDNIQEPSDSDYEHLNYVLIDSLLANELICIHIEDDYEYAVYQGKTKNIIGGHFKHFQAEILSSEFKVSLNCVRSESPYYLALYFPSHDNLIIHNMLAGFILSGLFVVILGFSFIYTVVVIFQQKKVSLMKNDFVNNMTHEFKTPIATVSLASEMLLRPEIQNNTEKTKKYAKIIYDENIRLKHQVDQILQIAVLDKGEFRIRKKEIDVHRILDEVIQNSEIFIHERKGSITKIYSAARPKIRADKMHFINIISNLLDNANKYSPEAPEITVRTKNIKNGILISVEDKGIGIKPDDQAYIFKQFHRVHTGNIHDVKGFGLGLFYAEKMVKEHDGFIRLNSTFGSGSTFEIYLPFNDLRNI
ncbi:MAG TPA: hypothetical protein DCG69_04520 [Bacteroidales bacterium]|nr:hypothetical protein [Bacteroidales bacterium]